jgi:hypothetical protein
MKMKYTEYQHAVDTFFMELVGTMGAMPDDKSIDGDLLCELNEFRQQLQVDHISDANLIGYCFGILDQYVYSEWKSTTRDGYELYVDMYHTRNRPRYWYRAIKRHVK